MLHEFRFAWRSLRRSPLFTLLALTTLAIGIGFNTAVFSVVNGVLLRPLEYPEPDRIVAIQSHWSQTGRLTPRLAGGDLVDIAALDGLFEALGRYSGGAMGVQVAGRAEFAGAYFTSAGFFRTLAVAPAAGRLLAEADSGKTALVSSGFAERNFGNAAEAIGKGLSIENESRQIVGVMPAGFRFPPGAEVWIHSPSRPSNVNRTAYNHPVIARLGRGSSLAAAQSRLDSLAASLEAAYPDSNRGKRFVLTPLRDQLVSPVRTTLHLLMGAVSLVLLITCANLASLLLARGASRTPELAVRAALGAGRSRILRQLIVESLVLALAGGAAGLLLAQFATDALIRLAPANIPRLQEMRLDWRVLAFAVCASLTSSVLFGLVPALRLSKVDLHEALKRGGGRGQAGSGPQFLRGGLVVAEMALCVILSIGAGLLFRSLLALNTAELGYQKQGVLVMYAHAPASTLKQAVDATRLFEGLFDQLETIPGVRKVAGAMGLPTGQYGSNGKYEVEGKHGGWRPDQLPEAGFRLASPGYFAVMGIPLHRGRDFSLADQYGAPMTAIVSASLAQRTFGAEDPVGQKIRCGLDSNEWMTIVGVAGDVRQRSPASPPEPEIYMPFQQHPFYANELQVVLRTEVEPGSLIGAVREKVRGLHPGIPTRFVTMDDLVNQSVATPRFRTLLLGVFAALSLALALAGVYGVMTVTVSQRAAEFGLRAAIGAGPRQLLLLVMKRAVWLTAAGIALGTAGSIAASRLLTAMVFGLKPVDPATYAIVIAVLALAALAAAAAPALRAAHADPLDALRKESLR